MHSSNQNSVKEKESWRSELHSIIMQSLKAILRSRLGNFVPKDVIKPAAASDLPSVSSLGNGLEYRKIAPDDVRLRREAAAFMSENFYREAVVPAALRLASSEEQVRRVVRREIDLFLDSGTCIILTRKEDSTYDVQT